MAPQCLAKLRDDHLVGEVLVLKVDEVFCTADGCPILLKDTSLPSLCKSFGDD